MSGTKSFFATSLLYGALGLALLFFPELVTGAFSAIVGLLLLGYGVASLVGFFTQKSGEGLQLQFQLILGLFAGILGILCLVKPKLLLSILPILFGLYILVDSLVNLKRGLDLRSHGYAGWTTTMVLSILSLVMGILILWNPFSTYLLLVRIIGGTFLYQALTDLWSIRKLEKLLREG